MQSLDGAWVCAIHGKPVTVAIQRGIGGWPIGLCMECRSDAPLPPSKGATEEAQRKYAQKVSTSKIRSKLSPLVRPESYVAPAKRTPDPLPDVSPWAELAPLQEQPKRGAGG